ncbi:MAG: 3'(2'),5'-bisphosphate nucleotidase [Planctomycetota bacterium]
MASPSSRRARDLAAAVAAVRAAAIACRSVQETSIIGARGSTSSVELQKDDRSPVTVADFASQALVCRSLAEDCPHDPVIAEEDSAALRETDHAAILEQVTSEVGARVPGATADDVCGWIDRGGAQDSTARFWTLDPIDGTKGFLRGEHYAIALALLIDGELAVGAVACPRLEWEGHTGVLFAAADDTRTTVEPLFSSGVPTDVSVSMTDVIGDTRRCESVEKAHSSHGDAARLAQHLGISAEPYRIDSQAKYGAVSIGWADVYLRLPTRPGYIEKIWDHAAGAMIVERAGGRVTDVEGRPLRFTFGAELRENRGVIATNGALHDKILAGLRAIGVATGE